MNIHFSFLVQLFIFLQLIVAKFLCLVYYTIMTNCSPILRKNFISFQNIKQVNYRFSSFLKFWDIHPVILHYLVPIWNMFPSSHPNLCCILRLRNSLALVLYWIPFPGSYIPLWIFQFFSSLLHSVCIFPKKLTGMLLWPLVGFSQQEAQH